MRGLSGVIASVQKINETPSVNVARNINGGTPDASSELEGYNAFCVNNGVISCTGWPSYVGWATGSSADGQWCRITFNQSYTIKVIKIFQLTADTTGTPDEATFCYGAPIFYDVQYWNGSSWVNVPGNPVETYWSLVVISGLNITTDQIRVLYHGDPYGLIELEAWT